jgi:hypothetical protein
MKLLLKYTWQLLCQWKKVYGLITFVLIVMTILSFVGTKVILPTWTWVLILIASLYLGTFLVYKETLEQLPKPAELVMDCGRARVLTSWGKALPSQLLRIQIDLNLRNSGKEKAKLSSLKVAKCDLDTSLLIARTDEIKLWETLPNVGRRTVEIPYDIPARDWAAVTFELPVELVERDPESFAIMLKELGEFEIELRYEYEDMDGHRFLNSATVKESFEAFRQNAVSNWIGKQEHRLVYIVKDVQ